MAVIWTYVLVMIGIFVIRGFTANWFHFWWIWPAVAGFSLLAYPIVIKEGTAAGAEWVMVNKGWVRVYELTSIKAYTYSNTLNLHFVDSGGRKLQAGIGRLQDDRRIWDLTYNGILHSVVNNAAETNHLARGTLRLPGKT
jgi:GMP synthase PP-ATPase subunit